MVSNYKRKTNRASYSKENLQAAVQSVKNGSLSGYMAAKQFKIPRMTIMDHVNNKRIKSNTLGRNTALSYEVEKKLATSLHFMEKHGFGLARAEMLETVAQYVQKNKILTPFKDGKPGNAWLTGFNKRHKLSVKKPQAVEYSRKKAINPFIVFPYFDLLEKTLKNLNLMERPSAIWNLDETSFSKDPAKTKIVGLKGHAATRVISSTGKENTTVLLGANAQGDKLPPLIIYKGKHMWDTWVSPEAYPNTTYAATKNGWMESHVFEMYFKKTFLPMIGDDRPVLLIYDGHATHVGLNIIEEARKANITILKLPAHTSHVLQPLDLAVIKSFKDRWDQLLVQWQRLNVGAALSKREFAKLIGLVWAQIDPQVLQNGFRKAGISPFNPKVVEEKLFDSLQLERWKDLQRECPNTLSLFPPKECSICEDVIQNTFKNSHPKTLISLALDCITRTTHERWDDLQTLDVFEKSVRDNGKHETSSYDSSPTVKYGNNDTNGKNEIRLQNQKPFISQVPQSNKADDSSNGKKIQVLEDRIVSFEELLLMKVKAGNNTKLKRHKVGPGAEIITHDDVLKRKMEENIIKNIKKEPKEIKITKNSNNIKTPIPGTSGITKKCDSKEQPKTKFISRKGKGLGKKSGVSKEQHKGRIRSGKTKRVRVASEDSTSVSDCISIYSDFDISSRDDFSLELTPDEMVIRKNDDIKNPEERKKIKKEENYDSKRENRECLKQNNAVYDKKEEVDYAVNDNVLVRYFYRKKWTYFIGYIEGFKPGDDENEIYYSIRFYKTVKKPLKFILTKKIDRDDVPSIYVVKKIHLTRDSIDPKNLLLSNDEDKFFF